MRYRVPVAVAAVLGIGGLVAATVGIALLLGFASATDNTRRLLGEQVEAVLDSVEDRLDSRLEPVVEQAEWIAARVADGTVQVGPGVDPRQLDDFMLGVLSGTPQVAGIAVVRLDGVSRRWARDPLQIVEEDWSQRGPVMAWVEDAVRSDKTAWFPPFWTPTIDAFVLLHGVPLHFDGEFRGMLGQIIRISDVSAELLDLTEGTQLEPFVLVDGQTVLAHPQFATSAPVFAETDAPLPHIDDIEDKVLGQFHSPDSRPMFFLSTMQRTEARMVRFDGKDYAFLYRDIDRYGSRPWTVGLHLDLGIEQDSVVERLFIAFTGGLAVLLVAVLAAVLLARRLSRPVQNIASVAQAISLGDLGQVSRLPPSRLREVDDASVALNTMVRDLAERDTIRATLGRYVPEQVARALLRGGGKLEVETGEATVLFCDIEAFTALTERLGGDGMIALLNEYFEAMVDILERRQAVVTQFQGDAILATFNLPVRESEHARNAIEAAMEMQACVASRRFAGHRLAIRIGINTGPLVAGAVGARGRLSYTVHGDAVNLASRLESMNKELGTRILVSEATAKAAGGVDGLVPRGEVQVRGHAAPIAVFAVSAGGRLRDAG